MGKKLLIPLMIIAVAVAFYEQSAEHSNMYITIAAFALFMFGMLKLSAKTPSKNQDNDDGDV